MTDTIYHSVTLTKRNTRRLQEKVVQGNLDKILEHVYSKSAENAGWHVTTASTVGNETGMAWTVEEEETVNVNRLHLSVEFNHPTREHDTDELAGILRKISKAAADNKRGRWTLTEVDGEPYQPMTYPQQVTAFYEAIIEPTSTGQPPTGMDKHRAVAYFIKWEDMSEEQAVAAMKEAFGYE